ncbi:nesprin-1-like protein [Lates japonicus]|uniref:Nesprin-1-like protein n=1 Tax=Lates japonicus TaxID=270547 RepID=A0AAD3RLL4_LATJO|nr:nesprin-1-like protein [Lates japonicus]
MLGTLAVLEAMSETPVLILCALVTRPPVQESPAAAGFGEQLKSQVPAPPPLQPSVRPPVTPHAILATLEHALHRQQDVCSLDPRPVKVSREQLETLIVRLREAEEVLKEPDKFGSPRTHCGPDTCDEDLGGLTGWCTELQSVTEMKQLQSLSRAWAAPFAAHLTERSSSKLQRCCSSIRASSSVMRPGWFLSQTEQKLAAEISGNYQSLLEQQRDHEEVTRSQMFISQEKRVSLQQARNLLRRECSRGSRRLHPHSRWRACVLLGRHQGRVHPADRADGDSGERWNRPPHAWTSRGGHMACSGIGNSVEGWTDDLTSLFWGLPMGVVSADDITVGSASSCYRRPVGGGLPEYILMILRLPGGDQAQEEQPSSTGYGWRLARASQDLISESAKLN